MKDINEAAAILGDAEKRAIYDRVGAPNFNDWFKDRGTASGSRSGSSSGSSKSNSSSRSSYQGSSSSNKGSGYYGGFGSKEWDDIFRGGRSKVEEEIKRAKEAKRPADLSDIKLDFFTDLSGLDLSGAKFSKPGQKKDLYGINFGNANLAGADFSNCKVTSCDFENASLERASFKGAKLDFGNFKGVKIKGADFSHSNLDYAQFKHVTDFSEVNFSHAKLGMTTFSDDYSFTLAAKSQKPRSFKNANFFGANFNFTEVQKADFTGADLRGAKIDTFANTWKDTILDNAKISERNARDLFKDAASFKNVKIFNRHDEDITKQFFENISSREAKAWRQKSNDAAESAKKSNLLSGLEKFIVKNPKATLLGAAVAAGAGTYMLVSTNKAAPEGESTEQDPGKATKIFKNILALGLLAGGMYVGYKSLSMPDQQGRKWAEKIFKGGAAATQSI